VVYARKKEHSQKKMRIYCECLCLPGGKLAQGSFLVIVEDGLIAEVRTLDSGGEEGLKDKIQWGSGCSKLDDDLYTYLLTPGFIDLHTHGMGKPLVTDHPCTFL